MTNNIVPGQMLGAYRILNQIGEGGMAAVYRAYHASMDRHVAVKVLPSEFAKSESFRARFQQEARLIANLEHPHILPVHDFGESDGIHYFVMRYLQAGTLASRIEAGPLTLAEIDRLFTQLADALGYAHQRGIVHRDLKPANVLIDSRGDAFLTDFGIAKLLEGTSKFTTTGAITGTPAYMSPEQAQGEKLDQRSDIYSLGIVLYEMVTGRVPFDADTPLAVMLKHLSAPLPIPSTLKPDIHPEIERVLLKALAKKKEDRYATAEEFIADWKRAVNVAQNSPLPASASRPASVAAPTRHTPPPVSNVAQPKKRSLGLPIVLGASVLIFLVCLVVAVPLAGLAISRFLNTPVGIAGTPPATVALTLPPTPLPGETAVPVVVAPSIEGGTWTSWAAGNRVFDISVVDDRVFTAANGSVNVFNREDGSVVARYTTANGLPVAFTNSVLAQSADLFWVATEDGLVRFQGEQVNLYNRDDGLDSDYVTSMVILPDGNLLAGTAYSSTEGAGLNLLSDGRWQRYASFPSANSDENPEELSFNVITMLVDKDGRLWVGTSNGLGLYDGSEWTRYSTDDGLPNNVIWTLNQDPVNGDILIGTETGSARFDGSEFIGIPSGPSDRVYGLFTKGDGDYWLSGGGGVWRYNINSGDTQIFDSGNSAVPSYGVYRAVVDASGQYYFGSDDGLVVVKDDSQVDVWRVPNAPDGTAFGGVLDPGDGTLWFQTTGNSGVNAFDPARDAWVTSALISKLPGFPILIDDQGRAWTNQYPGGFWVAKADGTATEFGEDAGLPAEAYVNEVAIAADGTAWLATNKGLAQFDGSQVTELILNDQTGLPSDDLRTVLAASDGSVWVGADADLAQRKPDGTWTHFGVGNPFDHEGVVVLDIAEDETGAIWIATDDSGVFRYQSETWQQFGDSELPSSNVNSISFAPDNSVWIGTSNGAARFDGANWQAFPASAETLISPYVNDVFITSTGDVYFATEGGVSRLRP